jgi:hypothetical protein
MSRAASGAAVRTAADVVAAWLDVGGPYAEVERDDLVIVHTR